MNLQYFFFLCFHVLLCWIFSLSHFFSFIIKKLYTLLVVILEILTWKLNIFTILPNNKKHRILEVWSFFSQFTCSSWLCILFLATLRKPFKRLLLLLLFLAHIYLHINTYLALPLLLIPSFISDLPSMFTFFRKDVKTAFRISFWGFKWLQTLSFCLLILRCFLHCSLKIIYKFSLTIIFFWYIGFCGCQV